MRVWLDAANHFDVILTRFYCVVVLLLCPVPKRKHYVSLLLFICLSVCLPVTYIVISLGCHYGSLAQTISFLFQTTKTLKLSRLKLV